MDRRTKITIAIIVATILLAFGIGLSISFPFDRYTEYDFYLNIEGDRPFTVKVPFPNTEEGILGPIFENMAICSGNGTISSEGSERGHMLVVEGNGTLRITGHFKDIGEFKKEADYERLSLTNYTQSVEMDSGDSGMSSSFFASGTVWLNWRYEYKDGYNKGIFKTYWGEAGEWNFNGTLDKGWNRCWLTGSDRVS